MFVQRLEDAAFECDVDGNPEPLITWYKDGLEIIGATQRRIVITEVDLSARAAYHCTALNRLGSVISEEAYLNIRGTHEQLGRIWIQPVKESSCYNYTGLAQYSLSVTTSEDDLSTVDTWV